MTQQAVFSPPRNTSAHVTHFGLQRLLLYRRRQEASDGAADVIAMC